MNCLQRCMQVPPYWGNGMNNLREARALIIKEELDSCQKNYKQVFGKLQDSESLARALGFPYEVFEHYLENPDSDLVLGFYIDLCVKNMGMLDINLDELKGLKLVYDLLADKMYSMEYILKDQISDVSRQFE